MVTSRRPELPPPVFRIAYRSPLLGSVDRLLIPLPENPAKVTVRDPEPGLQTVVPGSKKSVGHAASATPGHSSSGSHRSPEPALQTVVAGSKKSLGQA